MAIRRPFGCLLAALALPAWLACKDKGDAHGKLEPARCAQLANACGDTSKHIDKITEGCLEDLKGQTDKGCADKVSAAYDCYEKEVCGKGNKIWALEDLKVLADRNKLCVDVRAAADACVGK